MLQIIHFVSVSPALIKSTKQNRKSCLEGSPNMLNTFSGHRLCADIFSRNRFKTIRFDRFCFQQVTSPEIVFVYCSVVLAINFLFLKCLILKHCVLRDYSCLERLFGEIVWRDYNRYEKLLLFGEIVWRDYYCYERLYNCYDRSYKCLKKAFG